MLARWIASASLLMFALVSGLVSLFRKRAVLAGAFVLLLVAEVGWAWHRSPALFEGESAARIETRQEETI